MRLVQESVANQPEDDAEDIALDSLEDLAEDKVYSAMGMGKTILTVGVDIDYSGLRVSLINDI